jgi:hypothetical protein
MIDDRYEMKPQCLFVDAAEEHDHSKKKPDTIKAAHIMEKTSGGKWKVLKLNDAAGFIARFIVQGVDIDLIPLILRSEYGSSIQNPAAEVQKVLDILDPYLKKRTGVRAFGNPESFPPPVDFTEPYDLNFKPNWFAIGWIKF